MRDYEKPFYLRDLAARIKNNGDIVFQDADILNALADELEQLLSSNTNWSLGG